MSKTKVAYVINDLMVGGAQKLVFDLAKQLDKDKYEPYIFYLYAFDNSRTTFLQSFIENGFYAEKNLICLEQNTNKKTFFDLVIECKEKFKVIKPDIVHLHLPNSILVGGIAAKICGIPFIIHEHNTHNFHSWKIKLIFMILRPFSTLTICYAVTVEKENFSSSTVMTNPNDFNQQKIITVLNGIDVTGLVKTKEQFIPGSSTWVEKRKSIGVRENDVMILSAARFVKWKGHHLLIEALGKLLSKENINNIVLVIAGEGPEKDKCIQLAKKLSLTEKVRFIGARTDVSELLAIADIYSLVFDYEKNMSNAEAIGIASFEAMAASLPVIIGDYGSAHFYIRNWENGLIVKKNDQADFVSILEKIIADKGLREKIGNGAKIRILDLLAWEKIVPIYDKIYQTLKK